MNESPTVFVVDDNAAVLQSLSVMIRVAGLLVETFDSGREFLEKYNSPRPGCLVVDLRMPQMSGLGLVETLEARRIELPVIMISGRGDIHAAVQAMKIGVLDFLEKPFTEQQLLDAVHRAIEVDARNREKRARIAEATKRFARLTPREREVLALVVSGKANKQIASELHISPKTVEIHRSNVMTKMQADSLADLVRMSVSLTAE